MKRRTFLVGTVAGLGVIGGVGEGIWTLRQPLSNQPVLAYVAGITSPFYTMIGRGAAGEAQKQGVTLVSAAPPQWDARLQTAIVDAYVAKHVGAIIIAPCDAQALLAPLERASHAGIQVVTVDTVLGNGDYSRGPVTFPVASVASDNLAGGRLAGEAMRTLLGNGKKVYIQSTAPGVSATDQRETTFKQVVMAAGIDVIGTGYDHGSIAQAAQQTAALLKREPHVSGIFGTGDFSSKGVMQALAQAQLLGKIRVVRFDASQEAMADLQAGRIDVIISQKPADMGALAVSDALAALQGRPEVPGKQQTTGFVVIDRSNLRTVQAQSAVYH